MPRDVIQAGVGEVMGRRKVIILFISMALLLSGCDPATRYKVTSTIFDGVPKLPPAEQYCKEYHEHKTEEDLAAAKKKEQEATRGRDSVHPPYEDKRCNDCHNKDTDSGFVAPVKALCFVCHTGFIKGSFVHGPAAVGSCLECHVPHSSQYPSLLREQGQALCKRCHREDRLVKSLHSQSNTKGMDCIDCHDPHAGEIRFFLK